MAAVGTGVILTTFSILTWADDIRWKAGALIWMVFSGASEAWIFLRPGEVEEERERTESSSRGARGSTAGARGMTQR